MSIWPADVATWRDEQLAANSRHPLLAFLLETEERVQAQFGDVVTLESRNFAWAQLAFYFAETDAERERLKATLAQFKAREH